MDDRKDSIRLAASWAGLDVDGVLLNLRGHDLLLLACKQRLSFCYSQSHTGRRDFFCPFDQPRLMFDRSAWESLEYRLDCPSHPTRLTHPKTLHTLIAKDEQAAASQPQCGWPVGSAAQEFLSIAFVQ